MSSAVAAGTLAGGYVDYAAPPEEGVFEIGLVMAGAVSAGAYTAGVVDFLIEALDAWEAQKAACTARNPDPRTWSVPAVLRPRWNGAGSAPGSPPNPYTTATVDGGTMDNEPLELARRELAGLLGRNPRDGKLANRATVMIDPFPDAAGAIDDATRGQKADILNAGVALMGAWKDQARFDPADLALAGDENTYSRFLIAPSRGPSPETDGFALACGALGGFSGFLSERYRQHDYMLGRRNCQQFLRSHFCLPVENDSVFGVVNPSLKKPGSPWFIPAGPPDQPGPPSLPIIPLMSPLDQEESLPQWPANVFKVESLRDPATKRLDAVLDRLLKTSVHLNWFFQWLAKLGLARVRSAAVDKVISVVTQQLQARKLIS